jgi:hypothetical protein
MTVSFELADSLEERLRREVGDLDRFSKEAALVDLYRRGSLTHHELTLSLDLNRFETESLLKLRGVTEDCLTLDEHDRQMAAIRKLGDP